MQNLAIIVLLGGAMLMILGALVGLSMGQQLADREVRRSAQLRRESGELLRQAQEERSRPTGGGRCPQCGAPCSPERLNRGGAAA